VAMVFDYLGIRLDGPDAAAHPMRLGVSITGGLADDPADITVSVRNGVLVFQPNAISTVDAGYTLTRHGLNQLALGTAGVKELLDSGDLTVTSGSAQLLETLVQLMDTFEFGFALTMP
ncbi:alkyl sulfatase C-terminal domain-containing protein, partial [Nocardia gipuzkoensis]